MDDVLIKLPEKDRQVAARYVVLHHTGVTPEHFDLMVLLPGNPKLVTWRILTAPQTWPEHPPAAERIADHRLAYLDFEGDISGNRGTVKRIASGIATLSSSDHHCLLVLKGEPPITLRLPTTQSTA